MRKPSDRFSDGLLDAMRDAGDPMADAVMEELFLRRQVGAVNRLMRSMREGPLPAELPPVVREYLDRSAPHEIDRRRLRRAEEVFALHGPAILAVLGLCSLPASYAARKGVQVLHRTSYLLEQPVRRLRETAQIVVDVLAPGGLEPGGRGVRSAQKVRLVHASVRRLATRDQGRPWDASLGVPINQEDLAGTLMTFSYVVLEGLERLGVPLDEEDRDAYLYAWVVAGRVLGVDERLLPADLAEAAALTALIHRRQIAPSAEGRALTASLVRAFEEILAPLPVAGLVGEAVRFFLGEDAYPGEDLPGKLGLPAARWAQSVVSAGARAMGLGLRMGRGAPAVQALLRLGTRGFVDALAAADPGAARGEFTVPETLQAGWGTRPAGAASRCPFHRALGLAPAAA
jgi:uncharacterized protein (DUF2236 family)